jgi:hypothetical protein
MYGVYSGSYRILLSANCKIEHKKQKRTCSKMQCRDNAMDPTQILDLTIFGAIEATKQKM